MPINPRGKNRPEYQYEINPGKGGCSFRSTTALKRRMMVSEAPDVAATKKPPRPLKQGRHKPVPRLTRAGTYPEDGYSRAATLKIERENQVPVKFQEG